MLDAYIYEGLRTPFGRHGGSLAKVRPDDMLAGVMKDVMAKSKFKVEQVEDIVVGCGNQSGEDSRCVARHAGLAAGFPIEIPGTVLQRNCARLVWPKKRFMHCTIRMFSDFRWMKNGCSKMAMT